MFALITFRCCRWRHDENVACGRFYASNARIYTNIHIEKSCCIAYITQMYATLNQNLVSFRLLLLLWLLLANASLNVCISFIRQNFTFSLTPSPFLFLRCVCVFFSLFRSLSFSPSNPRYIKYNMQCFLFAYPQKTGNRTETNMHACTHAKRNSCWIATSRLYTHFMLR